MMAAQRTSTRALVLLQDARDIRHEIEKPSTWKLSRSIYTKRPVGYGIRSMAGWAVASYQRMAARVRRCVERSRARSRRPLGTCMRPPSHEPSSACTMHCSAPIDAHQCTTRSIVSSTSESSDRRSRDSVTRTSMLLDRCSKECKCRRCFSSLSSYAMPYQPDQPPVMALSLLSTYRVQLVS